MSCYYYLYYIKLRDAGDFPAASAPLLGNRSPEAVAPTLGYGVPTFVYLALPTMVANWAHEVVAVRRRVLLQETIKQIRLSSELHQRPH